MSCVCTLSHGQMYFQPKIMCCALWARVDTKLLNLSHHVLSMDGWPGDATFFLWGQPLKIIRMYSAKKGPAPWNLFLTPAPRPLQVTFFGWWSWTLYIVIFFKDKYMFRKKKYFAFWARVDTKLLNLSHHFLSMDGWPDLAIFSCGPNLWKSSACIQPKKVQPLGIYFWYLRLGLFKSPFLVDEAEHMWL